MSASARDWSERGVVGLAKQVLGVWALTLAFGAGSAFLLFQPLRGRLQAWLDRRLHRRPWARTDALVAFSSRLEAEEVSLEELDERLRAAIEEALHPTSVGVWLRDRETD